MPTFTLQAPGVVSTFDAGPITGYELYALTTVGPRRILHTISFFERRPDLGEPSEGNPLSWQVEVPAGALLFGVGGGVDTERSQNFWVGWLAGRRIHMQALKLDDPLETDILPDEAPVFPALMDGAGRATLYSWRPGADGATLWQRAFRGELGKPGEVGQATAVAVKGNPLVTVVGGIFGERAPNALIGWVEKTPAGAVLAVAAVTPSAPPRLWRSEPVADASPLPRQRLALWAPAANRIELAALLVSDKDKSITLARFALDGTPFGTVTHMPVAGPEIPVIAGAVDYFKDEHRARFNVALLTTDGRLMIKKTYGSGALRVGSEGLQPDDPLALLTGVNGATYRAVRAPDGTISLVTQ